jgi:hypothetical protein
MPQLEGRMNQILPSLPLISGEHYVHRPPVWLTAVVRLAFGLMAIVTAVWAYLDWSTSPLGFRLLACILVPAFCFSSLRSDVWGGADFIATDKGIFFPCNELRVITLGRDRKDSWLWVPWSNIENLRLAEYDDHDNDRRTCVAFDLNVSGEERADFFRGASNPVDSTIHPDNLLSVAYGGFPPSPKEVFTRLKVLAPRHNPSFHRTCAKSRAGR